MNINDTKPHYDLTIRNKKTQVEVTYIRCYNIQINSNTLSFNYYSMVLQDSFFCQFALNKDYEIDIRQ